MCFSDSETDVDEKSENEKLDHLRWGIFLQAKMHTWQEFGAVPLRASFSILDERNMPSSWALSYSPRPRELSPLATPASAGLSLLLAACS